MKTGIELIAEERKRQIIKKGFDAQNDRAYSHGELPRAAAAYALPGDLLKRSGYRLSGEIRRSDVWPWSRCWWKPSPENRIRELMKAGALIAAEIDRLQDTGSIFSGTDALIDYNPEVELDFEHSAKRPYDASDEFLKSDLKNPPIAKNWAHRAARAIVHNLLGRRKIKRGFDDVQEDVRQELVKTLSNIIVTAVECDRGRKA